MGGRRANLATYPALPGGNMDTSVGAQTLHASKASWDYRAAISGLPEGVVPSA